MIQLLVMSVCDPRTGYIHGRDHLSVDEGETTLCGMRRPPAGVLLSSRGSNIHDLHPQYSDHWREYTTSWKGAFQCKRCEKARAKHHPDAPLWRHPEAGK